MNKPRQIINIKCGTFGFGNFISFDTALQDHLLHLLDVSVEYSKSRNDKKPLNIYIEAAPGSGKSFLVSSFVKALNSSSAFRESRLSAELQTRNLSQANSISDYITVFEWVRTCNIKQAAIPIVFFDEVDSKINNSHIFKHFLAPMLDGVYYDCNGIERDIGRCILVFAASKRLGEFFFQCEYSNGDLAKGDNIWKDYTIKKGSRFDFDKYLRKVTLYHNDILSAWNIEYPSELPEKFKDFLDRIRIFVYLPPVNLYVNLHLSNNYEWFKDTINQIVHLLSAFLYENGYRAVSCKCMATLIYLLREYGKLRLVQNIIKNSHPSIHSAASGQILTYDNLIFGHHLLKSNYKKNLKPLYKNLSNSELGTLGETDSEWIEITCDDLVI